MTREQKLDYLTTNISIASEKIDWQQLSPDEHGDWLNKRVGGDYDTYPRMGDKKDRVGEANKVFRGVYSRGLGTSRDVWSYGFSKEKVLTNMKQSISFFNEQLVLFQEEFSINPKLKVEDFIDTDPTKISWSRAYREDLERNKAQKYIPDCVVESIYRPYVRQFLYYDKDVLNDVGPLFYMFPYYLVRISHTDHEEKKLINRDVNRVICVQGISAKKCFSTLMTNCLPDLNMLAAGAQCFPLYVYNTEDNSSKQKKQRTLFNGGEVAEHSADSSNRTSGITDWILDYVNKKYNLVASSPSPIGRGGQGGEVTKEDIFYYVYGILHCPSYREKYQNDFKKALPRIPFVERYEDFIAFMKAGRELGDLHCDYESCPMNTTAKVYFDQVPLAFGEGDLGGEAYIIDKLRPVGKGNFTELKYNGHITLKNIPPEAHEYIVNGRSPLGWIIDQYQVSIDKDSGIKNDPNDWCREHGNPRYILELILRVIEVSVRTMAIVKALPKVVV